MTAAAYKVLGQQAPTGTTETVLYTVPSSTQAIVSTLVACCLATTGSVKIRANVRPAGAAVLDKHALWRDVTIYPGQTETLTLGIGLAGTDVISVKTDTASGVAFSAFGTELS